MENKTTVTTIEAGKYDIIDFNAESDDIERRLAQAGEQIARDGSHIQVDTAWATGFTDREGEPMH